MFCNTPSHVNRNAGVQGFVCAPDNVEHVHTQPKLETLLVVFAPTRILPRALKIPGRCCGSAWLRGYSTENVVQLHIDTVKLLLHIPTIGLARMTFVLAKTVFAKDWLALHWPKGHGAFVPAIPAGGGVQPRFISKRFFTLPFPKLLEALVAVHGLLPLWQKRNLT